MHYSLYTPILSSCPALCTRLHVMKDEVLLKFPLFIFQSLHHYFEELIGLSVSGAFLHVLAVHCAYWLYIIYVFVCVCIRRTLARACG